MLYCSFTELLFNMFDTKHDFMKVNNIWLKYQTMLTAFRTDTRGCIFRSNIANIPMTSYSFNAASSLDSPRISSSVDCNEARLLGFSVDAIVAHKFSITDRERERQLPQQVPYILSLFHCLKFDISSFHIAHISLP